MEYRRFGRTELKMPVVSTGGMRFQSSWQREDPIKETSISNLEAIVTHALDLGINHFETAFGYGTSEAELGRILPHLERDKLIVQTKGGPKEKSQDFLKNVETSLDCLKLDYVDLFAIHGINNDDLLTLTLKPGGPLEQALKLKEQGVFRWVGFSTHGPTSTIIKAIETGQFDYVNLWYTYTNQSNWPAIQAAQAHDMGVFIISPNDKGGHLYKPPQRLVDLCTPLTPMTFNDLFILSHPEIHTISCGAARPEDLDEHCHAVEQQQIWADTVKTVQEKLDQALAAVYEEDWAQHYLQGVPTWEDTPGHINIPVILWLWNLVQAFDMQDFAQTRYNLIGNAEHWFPGQKADKLQAINSTDLRRVLAESPFVDRILKILGQAHTKLGSQPVQRLSKT